MAIGMGNLLDAFVENGLTNHVKGGILHMSRPPQAVEVESEADLEALGELPAGSIAYTSEYAHMWQLTGSGTWAATEEKGGSGGGGGMMLLPLTDTGVDATYAEVKAAMLAGTLVGFNLPEGKELTLILAGSYKDAVDPIHGDYYTVYFTSINGSISLPLVAETEDGQLFLGGD